MDADAWLLVAIAGFLIFCCLAMVFMRRQGGDSRSPERGSGTPNSPPCDETDTRSGRDSEE